jgi:hypothetical protein
MKIENRRLYIVFYDGKSVIPLAFATDANIACLDDTCSYDCSINVKTDGMGKKKVIKILFKNDTENGHVIYFDHPISGVTMYIRKAKAGFNFGIRVPEELRKLSEGLCTTGYSVINEKPSTFIDENVGRKVCKAAFVGLQDVEGYRYDACMKDVYFWKNVNYSIDHRLALLDFNLIKDYKTINDKYSTVSVPFVSSLQSMVSEATSSCRSTINEKSKFIFKV